MKRLFLVVLTLIPLLVACGGSATKTMTIDSAGGEVSLTGSNSTSLVIPEEGLVEETSVTLKTVDISAYTELENRSGDVVLIEPEDIVLEKGAVLQIDPGQQVGDGSYGMIYRFVDADGERGWSPINRSTIITKEGLVETIIDRFGTFAATISTPSEDDTPDKI